MFPYNRQVVYRFGFFWRVCFRHIQGVWSVVTAVIWMSVNENKMFMCSGSSQLGCSLFQKREGHMISGCGKQSIILSASQIKELASRQTGWLAGAHTGSAGRAEPFQQYSGHLSTSSFLSKEKIQRNLQPRNPITNSDSLISLLTILGSPSARHHLA